VFIDSVIIDMVKYDKDRSYKDEDNIKVTRLMDKRKISLTLVRYSSYPEKCAAFIRDTHRHPPRKRGMRMKGTA